MRPLQALGVDALTAPVALAATHLGAHDSERLIHGRSHLTHVVQRLHGGS